MNLDMVICQATKGVNLKEMDLLLIPVLISLKMRHLVYFQGKKGLVNHVNIHVSILKSTKIKH